MHVIAEEWLIKQWKLMLDLWGGMEGRGPSSPGLMGRMWVGTEKIRVKSSN